MTASQRNASLSSPRPLSLSRSELSARAIQSRRDESASGVRQRQFGLARQAAPTLVDACDDAPATERSFVPPEGCEGAGPGSVTMLGGYELREAPVTAPPVMMPMMQVTTMMPAPAPTMALYDSSADPIVVPMASPFAFVRRFIELVLEAARSLTRGSRG